METLKKILIFSQKKTFLIFQEMELFYVLRNRKPEKMSFIFSKESFYFISWNRNPPKKFNIFQETDIFYFSGNGKSEKRLIIQEVTFWAWKLKHFYTFPYKKEKLSKLKYFLIVIIKHFSSFYNIFFYTQPVYCFHLLRDFCNVQDHIVAFFLFLH